MLRSCTSTSTTAAATSTTTAAASTTSAVASTTSTAATEAPTPGTTPTSTATHSSATTPPVAPTTTFAPLALAVAASPARSRRSPDLRSTNEVDSSSRGNRGEHPSKKGVRQSPREAPTAKILFSAAVRRSSSRSTVSSVGQRERK
ncbi:unnamed protein product [Closterium sp. NIES-54]